MFKNEVIDRNMHCIMQNFKKNAQVSIYSLLFTLFNNTHPPSQLQPIMTFQYLPPQCHSP